MNRHLLLAASLALGACTTTIRLTEFTALSTKNVSLKGDRSRNRVSGESCTKHFLGIQYATENMKDAIDGAIESAGPGYDALEDGVLTRVIRPGLFFGSMCVQVTGTAIRTREQPGSGSDAVAHADVTR